MIAIFNGLCTIMQTFEYMHNWHHSSAAHPQSLVVSWPKILAWKFIELAPTSGNRLMPKTSIHSILNLELLFYVVFSCMTSMLGQNENCECDLLISKYRSHNSTEKSCFFEMNEK